MNKKALIFGVLGQDGSYIAELLKSKGYEIHGLVRPSSDENRLLWIKKLIPDIKIRHTDIRFKSEIHNLITSVHPDEIYNFAGISNVFNAWSNVDEIFDVNGRLPQRVLQCIVDIDKSIKYFQASSCLIFGRSDKLLQNEETIPKPIHPYGISKLYADYMVKEYRMVHNLFACSGIFFPHESERRGDEFFTKKIIKAVVDRKHNKQLFVKFGNLNAVRDYGYAPDYMEAAHLIMQAEEPGDYVIGTGKLISMQDFAERCFRYAGVEYSIVEDSSQFRENDTMAQKADITKIKALGWQPKTSVDEMIKIMVDYEMLQ